MRFTWFNLMPWPVPAGRLPREAPLGVGRHRPDALRPGQGPRRLQHLHGPARVRRHARLRRHRRATSTTRTATASCPRRTSSRPASRGAPRTRRWCVLGNSIALYNPPIRVAEEFAMLDVHLRRAAGRRLPGRHVDGHQLLLRPDPGADAREVPRGPRPDHARPGPTHEPFAFNGQYTQLRYVNCWPRPIQKPHPPIYIPGGGSIETWDFCLDHDYSTRYLSFSGYLRAKALMDGYWERVAERGKDESPYRAGFAQTICVADTDAEAERLYAEHVALLLQPLPARLSRASPTPPGYRTIKTIKAGALSQIRAARAAAILQLTWKELVDGGYVIAGSPETVRQRMEDLIKGAARRQHLLPDARRQHADWRSACTRPSCSPRRSCRSCATLCPEYADDDRFWCKPLAASAATPAACREAPTGADAHGQRVSEIAMELKTVETHHVPRALLRGRQGQAAGVPARRRRAAADDPFLDALAAALPRLRAAAARLRRPARSAEIADMLDFTLHGWDVVDALGLKRPDPRRPLDGRHDRRRDGGGRAQRVVAPGADRAGGPVARRASDRRHLRDAALRAAGAAVPRRGGGPRRAAHRRRAIWTIRSSCKTFLVDQRAPARHGGQDPVPDPRPRPVQAALPGHGQDPRSSGATATG